MSQDYGVRVQCNTINVIHGCTLCAPFNIQCTLRWPFKLHTVHSKQDFTSSRCTYYRYAVHSIQDITSSRFTYYLYAVHSIQDVINCTVYLLTQNSKPINYKAHFTLDLPTAHCTQDKVYSTHISTLNNCMLYTTQHTNCTLYCTPYTQKWKNQRISTRCMIISRLWNDTV